MSFIIGTFTPTTEGGWVGSVRTLTIDAKLRFVPNDNRDNENAPAFRVYVGKSRVGDAWTARTNGETQKDYLRVTFDGPDFGEPFGAALFPSDEGKEAQLVWRRRGN
ncbi:MAG: DUF736 family protein [Alphaproteobacteria bacterium]|nr:DUF736 family protein [Alphaproteobacteria bacterium]MDE2111527.1 DUF736 family protein [Alphaproteobacteria bacterium]